MRGFQKLIFVFSFLGFIFSILGYLDFKAQGSLCYGGFEFIDCSKVYIISQSSIMGFHISELAVIYFTLLLAFSVVYFLFQFRIAFLAHLAFSFIGLSFIPYLVYLELFVAGSLCLYCTFMHLTIIGLSFVHVYTYIFVSA